MVSYLKVSGTKIVDGEGNEVILRGAGLGGWMKYVLDHRVASRQRAYHHLAQHGELHIRLPWLRIPDPRCPCGRCRTRQGRILLRQGGLLLANRPPLFT